MAENKKTTEENASAALLDGTELVRGVAGGLNVKITTQKIANRAGIPKHFLATGVAAGDIVATGIKVGDRLDEVIYFVGAGVAVTNVSDLTAEFTITATNTINNAAGTATTGGKLLVRWGKLTA